MYPLYFDPSIFRIIGLSSCSYNTRTPGSLHSRFLATLAFAFNQCILATIGVFGFFRLYSTMECHIVAVALCQCENRFLKP